MSAATKDGGPAFPVIDGIEKNHRGRFVPEYSGGLSARDYFAAKAMQAAISGHIAHYGHDANYWKPVDIASYAAEVADAMILERTK